MNSYIYRDGQQYGPYTDQQLLDFIASGNVTQEDHARREDWTEWKTVNDVLRSASIGTLPPPLPHEEKLNDASPVTPPKSVWERMDAAILQGNIRTDSSVEVAQSRLPLVLNLLSLTICLWFLAIPGLILGRKALRTSTTPEARSRALRDLRIGYVGLGIGLVIIMISVFLPESSLQVSSNSADTTPSTSITTIPSDLSHDTVFDSVVRSYPVPEGASPATLIALLKNKIIHVEQLNDDGNTWEYFDILLDDSCKGIADDRHDLIGVPDKQFRFSLAVDDNSDGRGTPKEVLMLNDSLNNVIQGTDLSFTSSSVVYIVLSIEDIPSDRHIGRKVRIIDTAGVIALDKVPFPTFNGPDSDLICWTHPEALPNRDDAGWGNFIPSLTDKGTIVDVGVKGTTILYCITIATPVKTYYAICPAESLKLID